MVIAVLCVKWMLVVIEAASEVAWLCWERNYLQQRAKSHIHEADRIVEHVGAFANWGVAVCLRLVS